MEYVKRFWGSFLIVICLSSSIVFAGDIKVGTIINHVLSTDIKAYVNGQEIPSMNIDGHTAVVAEDLRAYGFDVVWSPVKKSLEIDEKTSKTIKGLGVSKKPYEMIGDKIADVLYTDIITYINGEPVESFNIDGHTAIFLYDLDVFGKLDWNQADREAEFESNNISDFSREEMVHTSFKIINTSFSEMLIDIIDGQILSDGKAVGFVDEADYGRVMLSAKVLAENFGYEIITDYNKDLILMQYGYSFKISGQNNSVEKYYNGKLIESHELIKKPVIVNDDIYIYDADLPDLFGLTKYFDPEEKTIRLVYNNYEIKDYGDYEIKGEKIVFIVEGDYVQIGKLGAYRMGNLTGGEWLGDTNRRKVSFDINYPMDDFDVVLMKDWRILMAKPFNAIKPEMASHELEKEKMLGPFTMVTMNQPDKGYVAITEPSVGVEGEIHAVKSDQITVDVERYNETQMVFEPLEKQYLDLSDERFNGQISLDVGEGIYRIKGIANIPLLHGMNFDTEIFRFFVNYKMD